MPYLRFQDDDESSLGGTITSAVLGAVAGFAVGMLVAQRVGGFRGLVDSVRRRRADGDEDVEAGAPAVADDFSEFDDEYDELEDEGVPNEGLEERVLEAFRNDPILSERAIDIGGIGEDTIELAGASVRIASLEDLIGMKRAAGRPQDQVDVEALEIARSRARGRRG